MYSQTAVTGFIAAHPIGLALMTAAAVGVGSYYLGKKMAEKAAKKSSSESTPAPQQDEGHSSAVHAASTA